MFRPILTLTALPLAMLAVLAMPATNAVANPACDRPIRRAGVAMGTRVTIVICPQNAGNKAILAARQAAEAGFAEFGRLEKLWTTWLPDSEVSRINAAAGAKKPVVVSRETFDLLTTAIAGSRSTDGLFDITFAPLGKVWRFDTPPGSHTATKLARVPEPKEIAVLKARIGWQHLHLDKRRRSVRLDEPGRAIHLGGIGKGAAVDRVVAMLRGRKLSDFVVQAGGDLYCAGQKGDRPWRVGIRDPRNKDGLIGRLEIRDAAFSTSGDYERFAMIKGKRYHHILDTRTGYPATASRSATVLAPTATLAEVLTKAAFIRGGKAGLDLLAAHGAQGFIVAADGTIHKSAKLLVIAP